MAKKDKDIFDKIMDWKIFGWFRPFYVKTRKCFCICFSAYSPPQSAL